MSQYIFHIYFFINFLIIFAKSNTQIKPYSLFFASVYDDNNILNESIAGFQEIIKVTGDSNLEQKVNNSLSDLKTQIESSLEKKQNEYNQQLAKKEESLNVLFNTYGSIEKEILQRKLDKFHEQKTIENLNTQIEILQTKLSLLKKKDTNEK